MPTRIFDFLSPIYDILIRGTPPSVLIDLLELRGSERILEIGAGTGRTVIEISKLAGSLWLLDPSIAMLRVSKSKVPKAKFIHGYAEDLPFPNSFFDRILAVDSLHHWDDQKSGINEVFRTLKPNGIFVLIEFDPKTPKGHYIKSMERILRMGSHFFTPREIRDILTLKGLNPSVQFYLDTATYATVARKPSS